MIKRHKKYLLLSMFLLVLSSFFTSTIFTDEVEAAASSGSACKPVTKHYSLNGVTREKAVDGSTPPLYITFNSCSGEQYKAYGNQPFYETFHEGILVYSPVPPKQLVNNNADMDLSKILENQQTFWGANTTDKGKFVDWNVSKNLKWGKSVGESGKWGTGLGYKGNNTGTTLMTVNLPGFNFNTKGWNLEWRYLGYTEDGDIIANPYFPEDVPSPNHPFTQDSRHWIQQPWFDPKTQHMDIAKQTDYDQNEKKVEWIMNYMFPKYNDFLLPKKSGETAKQNLQRSAVWWADVLVLRGNPEQGSASATALHYGYTDQTSTVFSYTFMFDTPPRPNLRVTKFTVTDTLTGQILGTMTRNKTDMKNSTPKFVYADGDKKYLIPGHTYAVKTEVLNMTIPELKGKDTKTQPLALNYKFAYDEQVDKVNAWASQFTKHGLPSGGETSIKYGKAVQFTKAKTGGDWTFLVPEDGSAQRYIKLYAEIPVDFYVKGENILTEDDFGQLVLELEPNDISTIPSAELIDSITGAPVDEVEPGKTYSVRFMMEKLHGNIPVGGDTPYASLSVNVKTDSTSVSQVIQTSEIMEKDDKVFVTFENIATPKAPWVEATWQITQLHRDNGQSMIPENDGPYKQRWESEINISVNNFKVKPQVIYRAQGQPAGSHEILVEAELMNANPTDQTKLVDVVVSQGSRTWKFQETLPPNSKFNFSKNLGSVELKYGDVPFKIEVNPAPRKWIEFTKDGNPYKDNVEYQAILVVQGKAPDYCPAVHTKNEWTQKYTLNYYDKWTSKSGYWTDCSYDEKGNSYDCTWVTTYPQNTSLNRTEYETFDHNETFNITEIWFKSKTATDKYGTEWINVTSGSGAIIKAGYGFELKTIVKYTTTIPIPASLWPDWDYGWPPYGAGVSKDAQRIVTPKHAPISAPNALHVEMPYTDEGGQKVRYTLTQTQNYGSWSNNTMVYEMPSRSAFGKENTRQVFVNEQARDSNNSIRIDTEDWYGHPDKVGSFPTNLCDTKSVLLEIKGANSDDIKSHITQ